MIDHSSNSVNDFVANKNFYIKALASIGYQPLVEVSTSATGTKTFTGFGEPPKPVLAKSTFRATR